MSAKNCWEFKNCGRESGGRNVGELGVCPVALNNSTHGVNNGVNGGRACWAVKGSLCGGKVQSSMASKVRTCLTCDFYSLVLNEEDYRFQNSGDIFNIMKKTGVA